MDIRDRFLRSFSPGILGGIRVSEWLALLRQNSWDVDVSCLPRAAVISLLSLLNSAVAGFEHRRYGSAIESAEIEPPVFILGLARSGTTLLHGLFAADERFAVPNLFQVRFPHTFLMTESFLSRVTAPLVPSRRSQDNVRFGWRTPGEEGGAMCVLSLCSNELADVFPRRRDHYARFYALEDVSPDELAAWCAAFVWFLRKLTVRHGRPLVLKTPSNSARVRLLSELLPEARFVYIHRNPYDIVRSQLSMRSAVAPHRRLQRAPPRDIGGLVSRMGPRMIRAFDTMQGLAPGRCTSIRFEDLAADPVHEMRSVYDALGLPAFGFVEPALRRHVAAGGGYRKNVHRELPTELREQVARDWRELFERGGYSSEAPRSKSLPS
jgi:hypothetical protein